MRLIDNEWPLFGWTTDIRPALQAAKERNVDVVLGTLIRVAGSSPRPAGTQMVFDGDAAAGYFSGGCLEADVANHAKLVLRDGRPARLLYGDGSPWIDIRLLCGGALEILLERISPTDTAVGKLIDLTDKRKAVCWQSNGFKRRVGIASQQPAFHHSGKAYSLVYNPAWRLVIAGGDPIALAIAALGAISGFETWLVRPNGPNHPSPIANIQYDRNSADEAINRIKPDYWTAVIVANHDDDLDDKILSAALRHNPAYLGVLGAKGRIAGRFRRLARAGFSAERLRAIRSPIGLARTGKAPWEVAVSAIAEIMQARNQRTGQAQLIPLPYSEKFDREAVFEEQ